MFYYLNASSVSLSQYDFRKLINRVSGSVCTKIVGLFALERLIRVNSDLVDFTNVLRFFNLLVESTKNPILNAISLRLLAVSLETYVKVLHIDLRSLLKELTRLSGVDTERQQFYRSQCIARILELRPDLIDGSLANFVVQELKPEHAV
jgi:hypothetical protein